MKTILFIGALIFAMHSISSPKRTFAEEPSDTLQIKQFSNHVSRKSGELSLLLSTGTTLVLKDNPVDGEAYTRYIFQDYYKDLGYYRILEAHYEWSYQLLINQKNGLRYKLLCGGLVFSPNKQRIVSTCCGPVGYAYPNGIQIWKVLRRI